MRHSHNDYWSKKKFYHAVNEGCQIIEADIICLRGKLFLSHTWRPFGFLTYGDPEYYFKQIYHNYRDKDLYLYIEIKTSDYRAIQLVSNLIDKYPGVKVLIGGKDKWFSPNRGYIAREIWQRNEVQEFEYFRKSHSIESLDLYKGSKYKLWNRW